MLVTFSGYNASGKTTAIRAIDAELRAEGISSRIVRFFTLDISKWVRPRPPVPGKTTGDAVPSVRSSERQPGKASKPFRWYHFAKMLVMAGQVTALRMTRANDVLLCSQYFYDNLVHFVPKGLWYRLAVWVTPRPDMAFLLVVEMGEYERRFLDRLQLRHGVRPERLPDADRADIQNVLDRYRDLTRDFPYLRLANSTNPADIERLLDEVRGLLGPRRAPRVREHQV